MKTTFDPGQTVSVITVRGVIKAVNVGAGVGNADLFKEIVQFFKTWSVPVVNRVVDVATTASGNALPRFYRNVQWNNVNASGPTMNTPLVGDSVMLGFTGGSSEFPHVLAHFPGPTTAAADTTANAPAPAPAATAAALAFNQPHVYPY